jgi:tyrosyl-tRNA synthetase
LLTKADGTKFGKTESGTIWLDPAMTSPYAFHQYFLNVEDEKVIEYLKVFSERSRAEIEELEKQTRDAPHLRCRTTCARRRRHRPVHSKLRERRPSLRLVPLFGREDLRSLSEPTLAAVVAEVGGCGFARWRRRCRRSVDVFERSGCGCEQGRRSPARSQKAAPILNNTRVQDPRRRVDAGGLAARRFAIVRRGRRTVGAVTVTIAMRLSTEAVRVRSAGNNGPPLALYNPCLSSAAVGLTAGSRRRKVDRPQRGAGRIRFDHL